MKAETTLSDLKEGDEVVSYGYGGFCQDSIETVKGIEFKFDEVSGQQYNVITINSGQMFDTRTGHAMTSPTAYNIKVHKKMKAEVIKESKKKTQKERLDELEQGYKYLINNFNEFAKTTNQFIEDVYKELNRSRQNALDTNRRVTDEIEYFDKRLRKIHDMVSNLRDNEKEN